MYKRNQLQDALVGVLQPRSTRPSAELSGRLKRLLELDRTRGRLQRSHDPAKANLAFYGAEGAGSGNDYHFSPYEAFSALLGLQLLSHGLPQRLVVDLLRRLRPQLERQHARFLKQDPSIGPDKAPIPAKAGQIVFHTVDPVFLVVYSNRAESGPASGAICRGQREAFELFHRCGPGYTFKRDWMCVVDEAPRPNASSMSIQSWDTAIKTGEENDYSAVSEVMFHDGRYYVMFTYRCRLEFSALVELATWLGRRNKPTATLAQRRCSRQ